MAPATDRTWEGKTLLRANQQETGRVEIPFRGPVRIMAMRPSLCILTPLSELPFATSQSLLQPTLDDLEVYVDISERTRLTSRFDLTRQANSEAGQFVTLSNFVDSIGGARVFDLELKDSSPVVGVNFKWVRDITGGPFYPDVIVGLAMHCFYLSDRPGEVQ